MLLRALFCTEMSCQEQGYPKISWWYLREWEGHCGWGRMRERFQLNQHGGRSVQASFLKLLGFKIFSRYNMSWLFARVCVLRSFVMLWDCFCIFLLCPWRTNMSYSRHTFDSKTNISCTSFFRKRIAAFSHANQVQLSKN